MNTNAGPCEGKLALMVMNSWNRTHLFPKFLYEKLGICGRLSERDISLGIRRIVPQIDLEADVPTCYLRLLFQLNGTLL